MMPAFPTSISSRGASCSPRQTCHTTRQLQAGVSRGKRGKGRQRGRDCHAKEAPRANIGQTSVSIMPISAISGSRSGSGRRIQEARVSESLQEQNTSNGAVKILSLTFFYACFGSFSIHVAGAHKTICVCQSTHISSLDPSLQRSISWDQSPDSKPALNSSSITGSLPGFRA